MPIFINTGFCFCSQDGIYHTHYIRIVIIMWEWFLGFICVVFNLNYRLLWVPTKYEYVRLETTSFLVRNSHHDTESFILYIHQYCVSSSYIRWLVSRFSLFRFPEWLCILFDLHLGGAFYIYRTMASLLTIISGNVVKFPSGILILFFCFTFIIPGFSLLSKQQLIDGTLGLGSPTRIILVI